jgi:hypothetical protein
MSKVKNFLNEAAKILESAWQEVTSIPPADLETKYFVEDPNLRSIIGELVKARTKAFRYACITQVLAKATRPRLNCLALQASAGNGSFDARSLCKKVVVPFEDQHFGGALGRSQDPYVSKPLRRPKISLGSGVIRQIKHQEEWEKLHTLLKTVENRNDHTFTRQVLKQILLEIRKLISQQPPPLPERVSAEQIRAILAEYLAQHTLGLGPQSVAYSLLEIFNKKTHTYQEVTSNPPTAADAPAGRVADIECKDAKGDLRLAVYVTHKLDLSKLENELKKCEGSGAINVLFLAFEIDVNRQKAYEKASQYGVNVAIYELVDFVLTITVLLNSEMRKELIKQIYKVLEKWSGIGAVIEFAEIVKKYIKNR